MINDLDLLIRLAVTEAFDTTLNLRIQADTRAIASKEKPDVIVERIGRVVDLKPKGSGINKPKRFDAPLNVLVADDKPAIGEPIRAGLADTKWSLANGAQSGEAIDHCTNTTPDVVLVSLSLPDNAGFTLFPMLRASARTKSLPLFGLCVKTAADDQNRALQLCDELSLKHRIIGSEVVSRECKQYEETKDWRLVGSFEEAVASFTSKELVGA